MHKLKDQFKFDNCLKSGNLTKSANMLNEKKDKYKTF